MMRLVGTVSEMAPGVVVPSRDCGVSARSDRDIVCVWMCVMGRFVDDREGESKNTFIGLMMQRMPLCN